MSLRVSTVVPRRAPTTCKALSRACQNGQKAADLSDRSPDLWKPTRVLGASVALSLTVAVGGVSAVDLNIALPEALANPGDYVREIQENNQRTLDAAEESFQNSDLLKELKAKSEANKEKNRKAIEDKYCQRQGEMGVGDCGGLRFIPGATKSGKQETPGWLSSLLGSPAEEQEDIPTMEGIEGDMELDLGSDDATE